MRQAFHTHKRHTSTKQPRTQKKVQKQLGVDSSQSSRPQSRHKQNRNQAHQSRGHSRHPASQHPIKSYKFAPSANTSLLKSFLRNSIQTPTQRQTEQKVLNSSLYKKLLQELQNMKKNYSKQITDLRSEIIELDQQIVNEKDNLLALIRKRQKMEKDVNKFTDQLVQLQQKNYQMYWDVAARMNQEEPESYEELLELEEEAGYVSRGLSEEEIDKLIRKWSKSRKVGKKQKLNQSMNPEQPQSCCICCHNLEQKDETCSLPCGHNHHNSCIKEWLLINKVCPLCRKEVKG